MRRPAFSLFTSSSLWKFFSFFVILALWVPAVLDSAQEPTLKDVMDTSEQKDEQSSEQVKAKQSELLAPTDDFDRGVPRSSVQGFLKAANEGDFERAVNYLDLRYLPYDMDSSKAVQYARKLHVALDSAIWIDVSVISDEVQGHDEEGLASTQERIARIDLQGKKVDILMQRVIREDGVWVWKFSSSRVGLIPELDKQYGYGPYGEKLVKLLPPYKFLGMMLWQWVLLIILVFVAFVIVYIPTKIIAFFIKRSRLRYHDRLSSLCVGPIRFFFILLLLREWQDMLHPSSAMRAFMRAQTIALISLVWVSFGLIGLLREYLTNRFEKQDKPGAVVFLRPCTTVFRTLVVVIILMIWFENMGLKATTLLTSLGVGGLAVALATQKSLENLIGAITLYSTTPVKVGDFCRFGDSIGTVEDIGLRYTRVRTFGRTVIHIPNASFVDMHLESYSYREKIWYHPVIKVKRSTSTEQMRYILIEIRKMLYSHPMVEADPARVRFKEFGDSSLDVHIFAYIKTTVYNEFLEVSEDLNLRIMDIVSQAGTELAVPVQNVWFEKSSPPEKELADAAEQQTRQWREQDDLCLPNFPEEKIEQLKGTLDYPAKGSAVKKTET